METKNKTIIPNLDKEGLTPYSWLIVPLFIDDKGCIYKKIIELNGNYDTAFARVFKDTKSNLILVNKISSLKKQLTRSYNTKDIK